MITIVAGFIDFGDRIADFGQPRHVFVARVGKIAAGDLRAAFEQMACKRTGGEPIPVVGGPTEGMQQWSERQCGIGNASGHDDVGTLIERLRDRLRTEIKISRDDFARPREVGTIHPA